MGTVAIVGIVAVLVVALVYDRPIGIYGTKEELYIDAGHETPLESPEEDDSENVSR